MKRTTFYPRGQASLESIVITLLFFLITFLAIEAGHWWLVRQYCAYGLSEALRQGSVQHARIHAIQEGFEQGLSLRFTTARQAGANSRQALIEHGERFQDQFGLSFYRLTPISPSIEHYIEFGHTDAQQRTRLRSDFYDEQLQLLAVGQAQRFQQALSLTVHAHYLHAPWSRLLRGVLAHFAQRWPNADPWIQQARLKGLVIVMQKMSSPMQNDPIYEPRLTHYFFGSLPTSMN